jgi:2-phosphosulfolactate phosphatase
MPELCIHPLPEAIPPAALAGGVVVVIDLLRATTTIVHALANGARAVVPTASVEEARDVSLRWPVSERLLGGERHGVTIEGFDLDNSPFSYAANRVRDKTIIFTTTNGTRAMRWAHQAAEIRVGAFANLSALCHSLRGETRSVHLLCAGTDFRISAEDLLVAGAIAHQVSDGFDQSAETRIFRDYWVARGIDDASRLSILRESAGGRNLIELGFDHDIERASLVDLYSMVPRLNGVTGELR